MTNPVKKFEIEVSAIGVWFTELDQHGKTIPESSMYVFGEDLEWDVNELTKQLQIWFNF